jgi:hypothetical protein
MIRKLDGMTTVLVATMFATFLLFSCAAKQAPREIVVTVPANFTGEIRLEPCSAVGPGTTSEVAVDASGHAAISACPQPDETVALKVMKGGVSYSLAPKDVRIQRAGDGMAVAIRARIPQN